MNKQTQEPNAQKKLFFGLFVFPLLIAAAMVLMLSVIVFLTKEDETPQSLISSIKTGAPSKKWQKAYELANELNHQEGLLRSSGVMADVIHMLNDDTHYDAKTRAYMAMALSRFESPEAEGALRSALAKVDLNDVSELPIFLMWAIGQYGNPDSASEVLRFLGSDQSDNRKTAAYVLGVLNNQKAVKDLKRHLDDPANDVRWNAALSLARLGHDDGWEVLVKILDRNYLINAFEMDPKQIETVMANAAKGFTHIRRKESVPILEKISREDPSLKVRQEALTALQHQQQSK
ncbi:MAG: hypothetical protein COV74_02560 [Candidatus Omnitrophica bacterium CG11_big_fil_rev_8_21_14_0_20_45_26]|uniref:HEAT repeat domain-containing protein n=1 Tax=Candidatus Abzuiibacterium crystallinum TaxID=1974748 RepID=A0A2H0LTP4_9BACT|nr:MAG: hypothetical protein COV74_02560 [Candidatus Omnitrophica bacterium CG11_big_fil_rev_8_21_14_0_20_45_26]PIW65717.1 MAG: hypothetical protein COW12_00405 [Candidatus Omnitrophica bacterium CG12_big_fil_rev_8_21_14_0_65_45_16]